MGRKQILILTLVVTPFQASQMLFSTRMERIHDIVIELFREKPPRATPVPGARAVAAQNNTSVQPDLQRPEPAYIIWTQRMFTGVRSQANLELHTLRHIVVNYTAVDARRMQYPPGRTILYWTLRISLILLLFNVGILLWAIVTDVKFLQH